MMSQVFGRFFWVWVLAFLLIAGYLSAYSVTQLSRLWIPYAVERTLDAAESKDGKTKRMSAREVILTGRNIFDPNASLVVPPAPPPTPRGKDKDKDKDKKPDKKLVKTIAGCPPYDPAKKLKETRMRIRLRGTTIATDPTFNSASILMTKTYQKKKKGRIRTRRVREVDVLFVGDTIQGKARICKIDRNQVVLYNKNKMETLSLWKKRKRRLPKNWMYGAIGLLQQKKDSGDSNIRIDARDQFSIKRTTVQSWLANPMQHAMSARIMPNYSNGKAAGFRMIWVRKKSLYAKIGLKSGDVVQQIDGKNIDVTSALGMYSKLPYAKKVRVNIIRKGVRRQLVYNIK